jgi:hypothetical protein
LVFAEKSAASTAGELKGACVEMGRGGERRHEDIPVNQVTLFQAARHLIEQPILGTCSVGAAPVSATCRMASKSSRLPPSTGFLPEASSLPR